MKQAGFAIGWGIQFQHPIFLAAMILILSIFAANMLGAFAITLPNNVENYLGKLGATRMGYSRDFIHGLVTTLLATPCSAPFVGTAVGFALSAGTGWIFVIFAALGFGLSLPFLLVAAFPRLIMYLPKPGRWMRHVQWFLASGLMLTSGWLGYVLAQQIGWYGAGGIMFLVALMLAILAIKPVFGKKRIP